VEGLFEVALERAGNCGGGDPGVMYGSARYRLDDAYDDTDSRQHSARLTRVSHTTDGLIYVTIIRYCALFATRCAAYQGHIMGSI
jgi:hypothetical protein